MHVLKSEVFNADCNPSSLMVNIRILLDKDLSELLPYLKATQERARFYPNVPYVNFLWKERIVNVQKSTITAFGFETDVEARTEADLIVKEIERVIRDRDNIEPDETPYAPPPILDIFRHLPNRSGCSECGHATCMAFAVALSLGECRIEQCTPLSSDEYADNRKELEKIVV